MEVFRRMSEVSGVSVSRCMGDWLVETSDAAEFIVQELVKTKGLPGQLLTTLQGLMDETQGKMDALVSAMKNPPPAPSSNTGLKSRRKGVVNER